MNYVSNCIELLRSRSMAEKVAERMPDSMKLSPGHCRPWSRPGRCVRPTSSSSWQPVRPGQSAIAAANAYLDAYQQYDLDQSRAEVSATRQFIEDQLAVAGPRLDSSERSLEQFKTSHQMADLRCRNQGAHRPAGRRRRRSISR